ncbi:MAG: response regulator [Eubacteriales bacterium]|nr:response regulator [Eubacteriales bacterium]
MWRVMAADDEGYIREALQKLINWEKMGCVLEAVVCSGKELLDQIEASHPDIVITDIRMPETDGLEVCRYVYEKCPETQTILLTAYSDFEYAKAAIRCDVCDYVLKVAIMEDLPVAVEKAIGRLERSGREIESAEKEGAGSLYAQIEEYIEKNYRARISLDDMAEALHANRSYLSRLYKNKTGSNLFDTILLRRIEDAKEYLAKTEKRTYEISEIVGFEDAGYFSRIFKKKTGYSPKDYRKKTQNEGME